MISPAIVLRGEIFINGQRKQKIHLRTVLNDLMQIPNWLWRLTNLGCDKLLYRRILTKSPTEKNNEN